MEPAPIWCGDVCELPTAPFQGVDAIIGGFPCQDISVAGLRAGIDGERSGLWGRAFVPLIRDLRPEYVFLENVSALRSRTIVECIVAGIGAAMDLFSRSVRQRTRANYRIPAPLNRVLGDLAALGYDTQWCSFPASSVGAPHKRERVFILAHAPRKREREQGDEARAEPRQDTRQDAGGRSGILADTASAGPQERRRETTDAQCAPAFGASVVFPPGPGEHEQWATILAEQPHLAPPIEPGFRVLVDGVAYVVDASRADQLRCVGNGVVALQAAVAARLLLRRINEV